MAEVGSPTSPITRQIQTENRDHGADPCAVRLRDVEDCCVYDKHGVSIPFKKLYQDRRSILIFVRVGENFWFSSPE